MDIHQSIDVILRRQEIFADLFYLVFLDDYPEVRDFFRDVDMRRQSLLLTMALQVIGRCHDGGYPAVEQYLAYLGTRHNDRGIGEDLYPKWRSAMLSTLERFHGAEWDFALGRQWTHAIDRAAELMVRGYAERFTV